MATGKKPKKYETPYFSEVVYKPPFVILRVLVGI